MINGEVDDCNMRRLIFASILTLMAIFGWPHTRRQFGNGAKCLTAIFYGGCWIVLMTSHGHTILVEGTNGKEVEKICRILHDRCEHFWAKARPPGFGIRLRLGGHPYKALLAKAPQANGMNLPPPCERDDEASLSHPAFLV